MASPARKAALLLCGPSGVGKGTLCKLLLEHHPDTFAFSVSHTTRPLRAHEQEGKHYHSIAREDMEAAIARGEFAEYAHVHGNIYGTSLAELERVSAAGKIAVLDVDIKGVLSISAVPGLDAHCVGVLPPSFDVLGSRLRGRNSETEAEIQVRLRRALEDMAFCRTDARVDELIVNFDSWHVGYPKLCEYIGNWWPDPAAL